MMLQNHEVSQAVVINFEVSAEDEDLIEKIVDRAVETFESAGTPPPDRLCLEMDITATHANGCPLQLQRWLDADDSNFMHDVSGIHNCIDRSTGKLTRCFLPRFWAREGV